MILKGREHTCKQYFGNHMALLDWAGPRPMMAPTVVPEQSGVLDVAFLLFD